EVLVSLGKTVIAIDLNPLSRTSRIATLPVIDEVTRAIPNITRFCNDMKSKDVSQVIQNISGSLFIRDAIDTICRRLSDVLD
ncbi:MAG: phosphopantothenate/pantothenate synthetase family protein, partial [Methanospirillum sp.]|nr:phosphopantothenate/pantothenate synthetase family protein [Methanospirillum sp.]